MPCAAGLLFAALALCALAVSCPKEDKTTTLLEAAASNNTEKVSRLIKAGADVNATDNDGLNALMWNSGETALMRAACHNSADAAKLLIEAGADVNATCAYEFTALMWAAIHNAADVAKLLINAGADMNAKGGWDDATPLMYAAKENSPDVAKLLITAGADVNAKNTDGKTALMWAEENGATEVIELLAAQVSARDFPAYLMMEGTVITGRDKAALPADPVIPDGVTEIGSSAFSGCTLLATVTIPDSVTEISRDAFPGCTSLAKIVFTGTKAQWRNITKDRDWHQNVPAKKVVCKDGEADLY